MQPLDNDNVPLAQSVPELPEVEPHRWRTAAITALANAHSQVQHILVEVLGSPNTSAEREAVTALSMVRSYLWAALKDLDADRRHAEHPSGGDT